MSSVDDVFRVHDPAEAVTWALDIEFLASNWTCIWDAGCPGIHDTPTPERREGCCSLGAEFLDDEEAMTVAALAATIDPSILQHAATAADGGILAAETTPAGRRATRVVDGACIFLNRPGFDGPPGCALHAAALAAGDSPLDWKPSVCWQLPLRVDRSPDGTEATLRRWQRHDWGSGGEAMAWCCTERRGDAPSAYVGTVPVHEALSGELEALVGADVVDAVRVEIRRRSSPPSGPEPE